MKASIRTGDGGRLEFDDDKYRNVQRNGKDWSVDVQVLDRKGQVIGTTIVRHSDLKDLVKAF